MTLDKVLNFDVAEEGDIAVISRKDLFEDKEWEGFREVDEDWLYKLLIGHIQFKTRSDSLEKNNNFKQIIPYFVVKKGNKYFCATRTSGAGEIRLHGKMIVGFGGHLHAKDIKGKMNNWLKREFQEELKVDHVVDIKFLGTVNDESEINNGVGKVHVGLVFEMTVKDNCQIIETDKLTDSKFLTKNELAKLTPNMELWSKIVTDYLANNSVQ
jgi:predicted NUDIX family phosphoesterase